MDPLTTAAAADGLVGMVKALYDLRKLAAGQVGPISVPEYIAKTQIFSQAFVEDNVYGEDIATPLLVTLNQMYAGYILAALGLSDAIYGTQVRKALGQFSTEAHIGFDDISKFTFTFDKLTAGLEATYSGSMGKDSDGAMISKLVEVTFDLGNKQTTNAYLNVSLFPTVVPADVSDAVISLNYRDGIVRRWRQYRAGEIQFWRDFIFARDKVEKLDEALRKDESGKLREMLMIRAKGLLKHIGNLLGIGPKNLNISTNIVVVDRTTFDTVTRREGINLDNRGERDRFFKESLILFLAIVDPNFARVELYINGVPLVGSYKFDAIKKAASKNLEIKDIAQLLAANATPRF